MEPYVNETEVREAIRTVLLASTSKSARGEQFARLALTGEAVAPHLRTLLEAMRIRSVDVQGGVLDVVESLARQGIDYANAAESLASHLNTPDSTLRQRIVALIVQLGPDAKPAEDFALGCLRNANRNVVMSGLLVLLAIGRACSRAIAPRIVPVLSAWESDEEVVRCAARILKTLRAASSEAAGERQPSSSAAMRITIRRDALAGLRGLVVEDNDPLRESLALALRASSMDVLEAPDGETALEVLRVNADSLPDIVVLDVMLPGMNGLDLLRRLREMPAFDTIPIIAMSAIDRREVVLAMHELGIREYLLKPVRLERFLEVVTGILRPKS